MHDAPWAPQMCTNLEMYFRRSLVAAFLREKSLQHSTSVFRHIRPFVDKQKEKMDETETNNWPMIKRDRVEHCCLCLVPLLSGLAFPITQCETTYRPGHCEKKPRGTVFNCSFPTVTWCWAGPACSKTNTLGFMSFSPNRSGQVQDSTAVPWHQPWPLKGRGSPCQGFECCWLLFNTR